MHLGRKIWKLFQLALSSNQITEFPHHSIFCVYVVINRWTPGEACLIANILGVAHTSTCHMHFVDYIYTALVQILSFIVTSSLMLFWITGPSHGDDLLYLFPQNHLFPNLKLTLQDEDMVETMTSLWANFAHTGYVRNVLYFRVQLMHLGTAQWLLSQLLHETFSKISWSKTVFVLNGSVNEMWLWWGWKRTT